MVHGINGVVLARRTAFVVCLFIFLRPVMAIELDLVERSGIERWDEPVTFGVPLPQGYSSSVDELVLSVGGQPVAAEIRAVDLWPDGTPRWVHVDFQASVAALGAVELSLEKGSSPLIASRLSVEDEGGDLMVSTGQIRVRVRGSGFNLFDQVWLADEDGAYSRELIASHRRGLVAWVGGEEYLAANDVDAVLAVESQGGMRLVLRAEGRLQDADGVSFLDYVCRLYFYNDSPVVRLVYTVENRDATLENKVEVEGLHVELPTLIARDGGFTIGRPGQDVRGDLAAGEAWVTAPTSDAYHFGGAAVAASGNGKAQKSDHLGWIAIDDEDGAVAMGLRDFWQMHPTSLEVTDGLVRAGLIPQRLGISVPLYAGVARTHYLRFAFSATADGQRLRSLVAAEHKPLLPLAAPAHYCRHSRALGKVVERNDDLYPPEHLEMVQRVEREIDAGLDHMLNLVESRAKNGVTREAYGFLHWGDGFHYAWQNGVDDDGNLAWNGHYYGLPYMMFLEFFRSGDWRYFDYAHSRAHHQMDMHITHFAPGHPFDGANRYCPPTEHVRVDPSDASDYTTARPFLSNTQNHSKTQGLFHRYYLTGDERALEVARKALDFARGFGSYDDFKQPRGAAHQVITLVQGYKFTGEQRYLNTARLTFKRWHDHFAASERKFTQGYFMVGLILEAFVDYYEVTHDQDVVAWLDQAVGWMQQNRPRDLYSNMALGIGFLAAQSGSTEHAALQQEHLSTWEGIWPNAYKDYAQHGRSLARALYYLSYEGDGIEEVDTLIPAGSQAQPETFNLDQNHPNPFNPITTIDYSVPAGLPLDVRIQIYDARGGLVYTLVQETKVPGDYSVVWDGSDGAGRRVSSGTYLCRMRAGHFAQTRKMVLLK
jgi:hypothetical protein